MARGERPRSLERQKRSDWHLADVHANRYFGRYRGKNEHTASTREPTRLTQSGHREPDHELMSAPFGVLVLSRHDAQS
jgi:hypothetical protein